MKGESYGSSAHGTCGILMVEHAWVGQAWRTVCKLNRVDEAGVQGILVFSLSDCSSRFPTVLRFQTRRTPIVIMGHTSSGASGTESGVFAMWVLGALVHAPKEAQRPHTAFSALVCCSRYLCTSKRHSTEYAYSSLKKQMA